MTFVGVGMDIFWNHTIDLCHLAALLSLRRIKSFVFAHGKPRTEFASGRGLLCKNKAFYSFETQHGPT